MTLTRLVTILIPAILATAAAAQPPGLSEIPIYAGSIDGPAIDTDLAGNFVVVWGTRDSGVLARRFSSAGEAMGDELSVAAEPFNSHPVVAAGDDGDFVAIWRHRLEDGLDWDLNARRFSSTGEPLGETFQVNSDPSGWQGNPAAATAAGGGFAVVWRQVGPDEGRARLFSSDGLPETPELDFGDPGTVRREPDVASDALGNFVVVWNGYLEGDYGGDPDVPTPRVLARRFSSAGEILVDELPVDPDLAERQLDPRVSSDADGGFVVVWWNQGITGDRSIHARRFSSLGTPLFDTITVAADRDVFLPVVHSDADGNFLVIFFDGRGHYGRHYSSSGEPRGGLFRVNVATPVFRAEVALSGDRTGNFVAVYEQQERLVGRRLPLDARAGTLHFSPEPDPIVPGRFEFGAVEGDLTVAIQGVIRTGGALGEVSVDYFTEPMDADSGVDYAPAAGQLVFTEQDAELKTFGVDIYQDDEVETDESFIVRLANPSGGAALLSPTASVGIFNEDFEPTGLAPLGPGPEFDVPTGRDGNQLNPQVAVSPSGEFLVVWESQQQAGNSVLGRRFDREGNPLGEAFRLHSSPAGHQSNPSVAFDNTGGFLAVWENFVEGPQPSTLEGRHFSSDGEPASSDFLIDSAAGCGLPFGDCILAGGGRLAAGRDGRFAATWRILHRGRFTRRTDVKAGIIGPGNSVTATDLETIFWEIQPAVASDRAGNFVVAWPSDPFGSPAKAQRFDSEARPAGGIFELTPDGASLAVTMADAGQFVTAWSDGQTDVFARSFDRRGLPITEASRVPRFALGDFVSPAISADPAGTHVVVWTQDDFSGGPPEDGNGSGIFARRFLLSSEPVTDEFPINVTTELDQRHPAVAVGRDGRFMVVWESQQEDGSWDVMARAFAPQGCVDHAGSLCFQDGRFQVEVEWRDFAGAPGTGKVVAAADTTLRSRDSAIVQFFSPDNWEALVKVLDARALNDHFWVFLAAATDVSYRVSITDTSCDQVRIYENPLGVSAPTVTDVEAFPGCGSPQPPSCLDDGDSFCLGEDGRFKVEVVWSDFQGNAGAGRLVTIPAAGPAQSDDSGLFYFFSPENWEMLVKVLDGCAQNGHFWVFTATATDVEYTLTVTDTESNTLRTYTNPLGTSATAITDTEAFEGCILGVETSLSQP